MNRLFDFICGRLGGFLARWQVNPGQFRWLLQASLKMDFRSRSSSATRTTSKTVRSALLTTLALHLIMSGVMAVMMVSMRSSTLMFSAAMLGYGMFLIAALILAEFGNIIVSPDDYAILAPRPVSSRTYFAVKMANLLFYLLLMSTALNLLPSLIGLFSKNSSILFPPVYFAVATLASVFTGGVVAAVYGLLLRLVHYERFKDLIMYCQLGMSFFFILLYQLLPRLLGRSHGALASLQVYPAMFLLPPFWFAGLIETGLGRFQLPTLFLSLLGIVATTEILPRLIGSISLDYSARLARLVSVAEGAQPPRRRDNSPALLLRCLHRFVLRRSEERAFFHFVLAILRRNRQLKMQILPMLGVAAGIAISALVSGERLSDPFLYPNKSFVMMMPIMTYLLIIQGLVGALPYCDEFAGSWIFAVTPLEAPACILGAVKQALLLLVFLPLLLLTTTFFSLFCSFPHAVGLGLFGFLLGWLALQCLLFFLKQIPFTQRPEKGVQARAMIVALAFMPLWMLGMGLLFLATQTWWSYAAVIAGLALGGFILGLWNNRRYVTALASQLTDPVNA